MSLYVVDGYNVIRRVERLRKIERGGLEPGREALLMAVESFLARGGHEAIVVFDGSGQLNLSTGPLPRQESFAGVEVIYSRRRESADEVIVQLLQEIAQGKRWNAEGEAPEVIVVTDDLGIRDDSLLLGTNTLGSELFGVMLKMPGEEARHR